MNLNNLSHRSQLIATGIAASVATASLIHAYTTHTRRQRRRELDDEIKRSISDLESTQEDSDDIEAKASQLQSQLDSTRIDANLDYDEGLIREQLARNYAFFGEEGMSKIRRGKVVVVGCGGVGSWAAVMLVRS